MTQMLILFGHHLQGYPTSSEFRENLLSLTIDRIRIEG